MTTLHFVEQGKTKSPDPAASQSKPGSTHVNADILDLKLAGVSRTGRQKRRFSCTGLGALGARQVGTMKFIDNVTARTIPTYSTHILAHKILSLQ
ncbi:hypothetical protein TWF569_008421 [Orbilia oligospora]|uniref:Uncharacterized protein n=1 Tax=Orbilia oligospora TaxID=2813651 RepID=A0A7C8NMF1_ORBOL|nr:hypothetical protein TWF103_002197 [Orbilia oligospora]KAF3086209.1 hypothetical protein TWF706_011732 [Orbilia oligospora]KAF3094489.1 hypothetical protein TWF102_007602 [Orbilia oligospora]KAF3124236.1 hypothetical protein TWF594_002085 [Orbilia oligospora]KAF3140011.1 hypothetical protein TWF569_008421 [Orbilia oligospora]